MSNQGLPFIAQGSSYGRQLIDLSARLLSYPRYLPRKAHEK